MSTCTPPTTIAGPWVSDREGPCAVKTANKHSAFKGEGLDLFYLCLEQRRDKPFTVQLFILPELGPSQNLTYIQHPVLCPAKKLLGIARTEKASNGIFLHLLFQCPCICRLGTSQFRFVIFPFNLRIVTTISTTWYLIWLHLPMKFL